MNRHVEEEAARVGRQLALGPLHVAARHEDDERLSDRALVEKAPRSDVARVEAALIADLDDELRRGCIAQAVVARERRRAGLLEEEMLPGRKHRGSDLRMVDRARRDDDGVDVVPPKQLRVGARLDFQLRRDLRRAARPHGRDRHQPHARKRQRRCGRARCPSRRDRRRRAGPDLGIA